MSSSSEAEFDDQEMEDEEEEEEEYQEEEANGDDDGDDDDESDDDKPLSTFVEEKKDDDDDDDGNSSIDSDEPLINLRVDKKKPASDKKKKASTTTTKKKKTTTSTPTKKKTVVKKKSSSSSAKIKKSTSTVSSATTSSATGGEPYNLSALIYNSNCKKGLLVQRLLCRWWYAITWPDPSTLPDKTPKNYDKLDGFTGVYIGTSGDKVGHILDLRDKDKCPNFLNFMKMSSETLQSMLLKALNKQKSILESPQQQLNDDGSGEATITEINSLIKWTTKVNPSSADKECNKIIKASKFTLP